MYTFATSTGQKIGKKGGRKVRPIDESLCSKKSDLRAIPELSALVVFGNTELKHPYLLWS